MSADDIEAIKALKARYFRLMDTKQWQAWADCFTDDCVMDTSEEMVRIGMDPELGIARGRDTIVAYTSSAVDAAVTVHHGHMPEIELTSATTATGVWAMFDFVEFPAGGPYPGIQGFGHYHERYRKGPDGRWRIESLKLTRLRVDPLG